MIHKGKSTVAPLYPHAGNLHHPHITMSNLAKLGRIIRNFCNFVEQHLVCLLKIATLIVSISVTARAQMLDINICIRTICSNVRASQFAITVGINSLLDLENAEPVLYIRR